MAKAAATTTTDDTDVDLLSDLRDEDSPTTQPADLQEFDLLSGLSEDEGTAWIPNDDEDPSPAGIEGRVLYRYAIASDYGPEEIPVVTLKDKTGTVWSIRGYATALRNQINKADPQPGDWMAALFRGAKKSGKGREYLDYGVRVKRQ